MDLFDEVKKLSHKQAREVAAFCASAALLLLVAGFISSGGMAQVNNILAVNNITGASQTGCVFPCNNSAYDMEALTPMQNGVPVSTVQVGSAVNWIWNAGAYGANNFAHVCMGSQVGSNYSCTVQINTPDTNFAAECQASTCNSFADQTTCDKNGCTTTQVCTSVSYHPCGNADDIYGDTCYGASGGYPPNYSCPGYDGNLPGTLVMTAPATPGTYTYYFCSNYLLHANSFNSNLTPLSCLGTNLIVVPPVVPPPTLTIDAGAGPGVTRTVQAGTAVTLNATFTPGAGDTVTRSSIVDGSLNTLAGVNTNVPPTNKSATFTPNAAGSYVFYPSVQTNGFPAWNNYGKSVTVVATGTPPQGTCANGLGNSYAPSCACAVGQVQSGSSCVPAPPGTCANGLANSYAPSCTCPVNQSQSGSLCVPNPPLTCANGLNSSYAPGCDCAALGQEQSGSVCVLPGVISSFTVNPSRVLKGNATTVAWNTANMAACSLSSLTAAGSSALSSLLSSTLSVTINSKTILTLTCTDAASVPYSSSITVNLVPQTIEK